MTYTFEDVEVKSNASQLLRKYFGKSAAAV
jgi:hypothetical protein